jgi:protein-tyrosine-phosphatase
VVLFACVHNSGRSVVAAALARHYAGDLVDVRDAGSDPKGQDDGTVASIVTDLDARVRALLTDVAPGLTLPLPVFADAC